MEVDYPKSEVFVGDDTVRGITKRDEITWQLFRHLARGDFRHDFNERVNTRDLIMEGDENRFFEIAKRFSKKGDVWLRTNFRKYVNKTIFDILSKSFDAILPPYPTTKTPNNDFHHEPELLSMVGIDFAVIKQEVSQLEPGAAIQRTFAIRGLDAPRSYTIRSSSYRLGLKGTSGYSQNRNVAQMFREVTGGDKKKFALIVDASGGLPLTEMLNTTLQDPKSKALEGKPPLGGEEFYIIENIENSSDSATKLSNIKNANGENPPKLFFLKDKENTVVYPLWDNPQDPKSNIYASLKIVLNRISDDEVEANIIQVDAQGNTLQTFNIGDVANSSNVKNATLAALAVFIDQGIVYESFVYTLIKRMGDWCQALSMLDLDRVYSVLNQDRNPIRQTTLRDMLVDTEIGVVTNDRILLAFCILHGLNVFFTSAMDLAKLIYFKNNNDVPSGKGLEERSAQLYASAQVLPAIPDITLVIVDECKKIISQTELPEYILQLRNFMSNVGRLRNEFGPLTKQYNDKKDDYNKTTGIERFNAANAMVSTLTKIQLDIEYNTKTLDELKAGQYPGSQRDTIRINALRKKLASGGRITKSVEIVEAKEILLAVRDDLKQAVTKGIANISALFRTNFKHKNERSQVNYDEILSVMPLLTVLLPGPQRGGANGDIVYELIRKRSIRVIPQGTQEFTSTVNLYVQGSSYIDEKLNAYTVADEYIVTKDDLKIFEAFIRQPATDDTNKAQYVIRKFYLLKCDIQLNNLFTLSGNSEALETGDDPGILEVGALHLNDINDMWNQTLKLKADLKIPNTNPPQTIEDIRKELMVIREGLIQTFPLTPTPELQDSLALQQVAGRAGDLASFIREYIGQKFAKDLGLLFRNTLNMNELNRLGVIIESNLISPSVLPETPSTELKDYVAELVGQAIFEWNPNINVNTLDKILFDVKQLITAPSGGGRRPLYRRRKTYRRKRRSNKTRKQ
jgi:hypothetical protein